MNEYTEGLTRRQMLGTGAGAAVALVVASTAQAQPAEPEKPQRLVSKEELKDWTQHLAAKIAVGTSLNETLAFCTEQAQSEMMRRISQDLATIIALGYPPSRVLALYPTVFSDDYLAVVRYGEMMGNLDETLQKLLDNWDKIIK